MIISTIKKKKNIALIAHDGKKEELLNWVIKNKEILKKHNLFATGTTGNIIKTKAGLDITIFNSGPLGGDQQIGSRIVEGLINLVIFISDPLASQPHDPDVKALLRITAVYDIPIANNLSTADFIINSVYMEKDYEHEINDYKNTMNNRISEFLSN